jgi:hypothetical protein
MVLVCKEKFIQVFSSLNGNFSPFLLLVNKLATISTTTLSNMNM